MGHARPHWLHTRSEPCVRSWELGNGPAGYCPGPSAAPPASRPPRGRGTEPHGPDLLVAAQHGGRDEGLAAQLAAVLLVALVHHLHVHVQRVLPLEGRVAVVALEGPLTLEKEVTREENEAPQGVPPAAPTRLLGWTPTGWLQALTTCPTTKGNGSQRVGCLLCRISVRPGKPCTSHTLGLGTWNMWALNSFPEAPSTCFKISFEGWGLSEVESCGDKRPLSWRGDALDTPQSHNEPHGLQGRGTGGPGHRQPAGG